MSGFIYVLFAVSFGLAGGAVGRAKGSSFILWFLISAIVPVIGLLAALLYRVDHDEARRTCPTCGRECMLHDALCVRCGTELDYTEDVVVRPRETQAG